MTTHAEQRLRMQIRTRSERLSSLPKKRVTIKKVSRFGHTLTNSPSTKKINQGYRRWARKVSLVKVNLPEISE